VRKNDGRRQLFQRALPVAALARAFGRSEEFDKISLDEWLFLFFCVKPIILGKPPRPISFAGDKLHTPDTERVRQRPRCSPRDGYKNNNDLNNNPNQE
jgi:hypothetical protein